MKKRKSILGLVFLTLILILGVGYATVNSTFLSFSGTATVKDYAIDVHFTEVVSHDAKASGTISDTDNTVATINVVDLETVGETASVTFKVYNADEYYASFLNVIAEETKFSSNASYFGVSVTKSSEQVIWPEDYIEVTVTVELLAIPLTENQSTASFTVKLEAKPTNK